MLLFNFQVREAFTPSPMEGDVFADSKADAFNQIVEFYTHELGTSAEELKISLWEVA